MGRIGRRTQDSNFHKVFLKKFLPAMGMIGNQKSKVAYWILKNLNNDNELKYSYRQIAKKRAFLTRPWRRPSAFCRTRTFCADPAGI